MEVWPFCDQPRKSKGEATLAVEAAEFGWSVGWVMKTQAMMIGQIAGVIKRLTIYRDKVAAPTHWD
jgi:hypothetical protein